MRPYAHVPRFDQHTAFGRNTLSAHMKLDRRYDSNHTDKFFWHLQRRQLHETEWKMVKAYETEREATDAMLALPVEPCDYVITYHRVSKAALKERKVA